MALGGAPSLVLLLGVLPLWNCVPRSWAQEMDEEAVSAPPNLLALLPAAAKATVAAGYTNNNGDKESTEVDATGAHGIVSGNPVAQGGMSEASGAQSIMSEAPQVQAVVTQVPEVHVVVPEAPQVQAVVPQVPEVHVVVPEVPQTHTVMSEITVAHEGVSTTPGTSSGKEGVIIVGDTRYAWQDWSKWHCNCPKGSMSRVRDITYSAPGVRLDPTQYDVLRFERKVCSYQVCMCNRGSRECDHLAVTCAKGPMHLCALEDIKQDQAHELEQFWHRVYEGLKTLWQVIRNTFPETAKERSE